MNPSTEEPHQFGVDLGVEPGVPDEVDDPPLRLLGSHVELVCQHAERREQREEPSVRRSSSDHRGAFRERFFL